MIANEICKIAIDLMPLNFVKRDFVHKSHLLSKVQKLSVKDGVCQNPFQIIISDFIIHLLNNGFAFVLFSMH